MQYALLIYENPESQPAIGEDERQAVTDEYSAISGLPEVVGGAHLHPAEMATTVRVQGHETITTDGPFADTKEVFGGFFLVEADDVDAALAVAARVPAARFGGSVEVRPIVDRSS